MVCLLNRNSLIDERDLKRKVSSIFNFNNLRRMLFYYVVLMGHTILGGGHHREAMPIQYCVCTNWENEGTWHFCWGFFIPKAFFEIVTNVVAM